MACDMCGKDSVLFKTMIEGSLLNVCENCSKYGKIIEKVEKEPVKSKIIKRKIDEPNDFIVDGYFKIIKEAREKKNLTQKELAMKINEKESVIEKIEQGKMEPDIFFAKKLGNFLNIKLIEKIEIKEGVNINFKDKGMTIGDLLKMKK